MKSNLQIVLNIMFVFIIVLGAYAYWTKGDNKKYKDNDQALIMKIEELQYNYDSAQVKISSLEDSLVVQSERISVKENNIEDKQIKYVYIKSNKKSDYSSLDTAGYNSKLRIVLANADTIMGLTTR